MLYNLGLIDRAVVFVLSLLSPLLSIKLAGPVKGTIFLVDILYVTGS